ncbi:MAG TPA: TonB-dependent receptor [Vicinamibacterales bacterium]|nr:TonB-dependent receptor [Vicinamibacterales bacterium]
MRRVAIMALTVLILSTGVAVAQSDTATVTGTIIDETGAVVTDVDIVLLNTATSQTRTTMTDAEGSFAIPLLPAGHYSLSARRDGFTPLDVPDVVLRAKDHVALRLELKVAAYGEQIVVTPVTGSRLARVDGRTVQPVTVMDGDQIRNGEVGTPLELMNRLPVLGQLSAYENQDGGKTRGSASSINLRGLGGQNTLILLDGRRLPYYSLPLGSLVFYNINNLPLAAVDRVEVLRDGASAVYGADATAGVVNFITRHEGDYRSVAVRAGSSFDAAAPEIRSTLAYGKGFDGGRSRVYLTLDGFGRGTLMAGDRSFTAIGDKRGLVPEPFGSSDTWNDLTNLGPYGSFTVVSQTGLPNKLPGMSTNKAYTDFNGQIAPGTRSPDAYFNDGSYFSVVPRRVTQDAVLSLTHRMNGGAELFADVSFNHIASRAQQSPMTIASTQNRDANDQPMVIPADNFYNPFGTRFFGPGTAHPTIAPRAVQFNFLEAGFGPRIGDIASSQDRELVGLRGSAGGAWAWEAAVLHSANRARDTTQNMISRSALAAALARSTPDAFNMFAGPGANPASVLDSIRTTSYIGGHSQLDSVDVKLSGPLTTLPTGHVDLAAGAEFRREALSSDYSPNFVANDVVNVAGQDNFSAARRVGSAYGEIRVPVAHSDSRGWFREAEVQVAGRLEHFNDFGTTAKPRLGLSTAIRPSVFLRASLGRGFRAPTLTQLYGAEAHVMAARVDPFRPQDGRVRRLIRQPSVATLQPEQSDSQTVGVVLEPPFAHGLSLDLDWWRYNISDEIAVVSRDTEIALEAAGGPYSNPYIVRLAPTAEEPVGPLTEIFEPLKNYARAKTDGLDISVNQVVVRGQTVLRAGMDATYIHAFERQLDPTAPPESFPTDQSRPRFRAVWHADLTRAAWQGGVVYQYTSSYDPTDPVVVDGIDYQIPSYGTLDTMLARNFRRRPSSHVKVTFGVSNLLGSEPPLYPTRQGYDASLASPRGRFGYINIEYGF